MNCKIFHFFGYPHDNHEISFRPINLKVLFRPISMTTPDIKHIVEVILVSFGFSHAKALSGKIMGFYQFCADLLSSQAQYDFGVTIFTRKMIPFIISYDIFP